MVRTTSELPSQLRIYALMFRQGEVEGGSTTGKKRPALGAWRLKPAPPKARAMPTCAEWYAVGKALRETCFREAHAAWKAPAGRTDAVQLFFWVERAHA
jgi:hypothetical protein